MKHEMGGAEPHAPNARMEEAEPHASRTRWEGSSPARQHDGGGVQAPRVKNEVGGAKPRASTRSGRRDGGGGEGVMGVQNLGGSWAKLG